MSSRGSKCGKLNKIPILLYLLVSTRAAIGQFCGPYFTVRTPKFERYQISFAAVVLHIEEI